MKDYHLRVGDVISDTAPPAAAPVKEMRFDETEVGKTPYVSLTEIVPQSQSTFAAQTEFIPAHLRLTQAAGMVEYDVFSSIYNPGKLALLIAWSNRDAAKSCQPRSFEGVKDLRHRVVRVVRDYGMFDRPNRRSTIRTRSGIEPIQRWSCFDFRGTVRIRRSCLRCSR
jgi:quinol monooxygenase YgiN